MKNLLKKNYLKTLYPLFLGIITSYSLPPYNYFIINFFTLSLFFIFIVSQQVDINKKFKFFFYGWLFGFGYFISSLYWISIALTFDNNFKFLIPISLILIPSFLGIFYGIVIYIFSFFIKKKNISLILIFSLIFALIEFIRGFIFTGFPWNLFAFSFSNSLNFIQILSSVGTYSFNMLCISIFLLPTIFYLKSSSKDILYLIFLLFIPIIYFNFNSINEYKLDKNTLKKNDYVIKILSSKININRFYDDINERKIIEDLIKISEPQKDIPTIFIWPEGIITSTDIKEIKKYKKIFSQNFSKKHLIILGINETVFSNGNEKTFNSLVLLDHNLNLKNIYHKNNLVPFGEFLPFEKYLNSIGLRSITNGYRSFSSGDIRKIVNLNNDYFNLSFLPLICYEIIYSGELSDNKNFNFIVNISEDGWFGNSIGPEQHFSHSIFRAIEEGKSIIRSSNNGRSAYINSYGEIISEMESTQSGVIEVTNTINSKNTIFSRFGNKIFFALIVIYISLIFFINKRRT